MSELEKSMNSIDFWAYDTSTLHPERVMVNLNILQVRTAVSPERYIKETYKEVEQLYKKHGIDYKFIDQDIVRIGSHSSVARTVFQQKVGVEMKSLQYILKNKSTIWIITFTTGKNDLDRYEQGFDKVIESLVLY